METTYQTKGALVEKILNLFSLNGMTKTKDDKNSLRFNMQTYYGEDELYGVLSDEIREFEKDYKPYFHHYIEPSN